MKRLSLLIALSVASAGPVLAQSVDCANIPDMAIAEPPQYANCRAPGEPVKYTEAFTAAPAFGMEVRGGSATTPRGFFSFNASSPATTTLVAADTDNYFAGDYAGDDFTQIYAILSPAAGAPSSVPSLFRINTATGAETLVGSTGLAAGNSPLGMAWDYTNSTMYVTAGAGTPAVTSLYTLNLTTGAMTLVAPITGGGITLGINLLSHPTTGVLYTVDSTLDDLFSVDKATGAATLIGDIGYAINFAQGGDFDNATGTAYICAYQGGGVNSVRTLNLTTGLSTAVGAFDNAEVDICAIATTRGTAPTGPQLAASPGNVAFGSVTTGQTSTARTVTLTNSGTAATTITAITATGAGFTVAPGTLPRTVAAGGTTTFTVTFAPTAVGAATGSVSIASNAAGSPLTVALTGTGASPTPPGTFPSTDTPRAIPDNAPAGVTSTIVVPATATGLIADLDVSLNITHTWVGDLVISLTRGAQTASLADRPGTATTPPTASASCSSNNMVVVVADGGAAGSLETACTGIADASEAYTSGGLYAPNTPLSVFNNTPRAGSYVLTLSDNAGLDTGTLNSWALVILGATAGEGTAGASASRLSVSPNPVAGQGQVNLTVGSAQDVRVALFDALGREVSVLLDRSMAVGEEAYIGFTTAGLPSGVYVVRATGTDVNLTQRVTVVR